jgi:hypothetical protein
MYLALETTFVISTKLPFALALYITCLVTGCVAAEIAAANTPAISAEVSPFAMATTPETVVLPKLYHKLPAPSALEIDHALPSP